MYSDKIEAALEALRRSSDDEHSQGVNLRSYVSDIVFDAVQIIATEGRDFMWGVVPTGSHFLALGEKNDGSVLTGVGESYGSRVVWYVWNEGMAEQRSSKFLQKLGDHHAGVRYFDAWHASDHGQEVTAQLKEIADAANQAR